MGKVMRHTLGASLNIRHNLSSSKGPKPLQLKLLTTYIPKTSAFTLAFSTSQRLRTTRASARTFFTFRHYITPSSLITISTTPVIAGDSFEMDAVGALRLSPLRRGLAIDSTVDIFTFYV